MTVRVSKPAFNLRSKLNELDYGHVPYEKMPPGSIIQVKYTMIHNGGTSSYNSSSTTYNDTGHDVLISPRLSTSKILVSLGVQIYATNSAYHSYVGIVRDDDIGSGVHNTSNNVLFHASTLWESSGPGQANNIAMSFLDSPQTTNQVKYSMYVKSDSTNNTVYVNGSSHSDCFIMAQEVKQ